MDNHTEVDGKEDKEIVKRGEIKRKTPLRAKNGFKKKTGTLSRKPTKKRSESTTGRKKAKSKKPSMRLLKQKLWNECKRIIRQRYGNGDGTFTCYTCGAHLDTPAKAQTGHFIPSSVCSVHMRYSLDNLRVQCYRCNINLSGNWIEYEKRLLEEGVNIKKLKAENEITKNQQYDSLWYEKKIEEYRML